MATSVSSSRIDLDWADNSEPDLAGYNVHRGVVTGFTPDAGNRIATGVAASSFIDTGLSAATTYYYKVVAEDTSGNQSAASNESSATTSGSCTPSSVHVSTLSVSTVNAGQGNKQGQAQVGVVDDCGSGVSSTIVNGTFTGDFNESLASSTNAGGTATLTTNGQTKGSVTFTFCVDSITSGGLGYDPGANVQTCASL